MAKFQEGQQKPENSGRKRGTPNRRTLSLHETLESVGLNIPEELAGLLPQLSPEKRADVLMDLMNYLYPKRKATENLNVLANVLPLDSASSSELIRKAEELSEMRSQIELKIHGSAENVRKWRLAEIDRLKQIHEQCGND